MVWSEQMPRFCASAPPPMPFHTPGARRRFDRRALENETGEGMSTSLVVTNRPAVSVLFVGVALLLSTTSVDASPCTAAIAKFEKAVRESPNNPEAGPTAPQSIAPPPAPHP